LYNFDIKNIQTKLKIMKTVILSIILLILSFFSYSQKDGLKPIRISGMGVSTEVKITSCAEHFCLEGFPALIIFTDEVVFSGVMKAKISFADGTKDMFYIKAIRNTPFYNRPYLLVYPLGKKVSWQKNYFTVSQESVKFVYKKLPEKIKEKKLIQIRIIYSRS